jgi:HTH-type transcriptional regulator / antitoxin HigA
MTDLTAPNGDAPFSPDWASPPSDTILDLLEERGWTQQQLADLLGYSTEQASQLIDGKAPLTEGDALQLQDVLGIPSGFWLNREAQYQARLAPMQD